MLCDVMHHKLGVVDERATSSRCLVQKTYVNLFEVPYFSAVNTVDAQGETV
jgi:hypothetical protein